MKFRLFLLVLVLLLTGCAGGADYQSDINDLKNRVAALEKRCSQMNDNIAAIQSLAEAAQNGKYITAVTQVTQNGEEIGYTISFSQGNPITIYHGKDGKDGRTPAIGVKEDTDGVFYWTVDGNWLLDSAGKKVKAVGTDGNDGHDGVTPQLKIEDDYWYVSLDGGETWTEYGKATGADGDSFFKFVSQDDNNVYFTLADNTVLSIPKSSILKVTFDTDGVIPLQVGIPKDIAYTVTSSLKPVKVEVITSSDIKATVIPASTDGLKGKISLECTSDINASSQIVVMIYNGVKMISSTLTPVPDTNENGYEWVDLGLSSGLKWATCNVGAGTPEEYGDYFAWGETEPKNEYNWSTYKWCDGGSAALTKYNDNFSYGPVVDNKVILEGVDDIAQVEWKGNWRMPTKAEFLELITSNYCTREWIVQDGIHGIKITGNKNGNSIFLPTAGTVGYYWSSSLDTDLPSNAWYLTFNSDGAGLSNEDVGRYSGHSVRPVTDKGVRIPVRGLSIDRSCQLCIGETATIAATIVPSNATQPVIIWSSSDITVATISYLGDVTAVGTGMAVITATTYDGNLVASCNVYVKKPVSGFENGYEWVDLGLPSGLRWAVCNVGASSIEDYGDYFAWGETTPKSSYEWSNYKFRTSGDSWDNIQFSKYITNSSYGPVDNKTTLEMKDDAARVNWGGKWRMPTWDDFAELRENCKWECTSKNGVPGKLFISKKNGHTIFFPLPGLKYDSTLDGDDIVGMYWSSSISDINNDPTRAMGLDITPTKYAGYQFHNPRYTGISVRPVCEE